MSIFDKDNKVTSVYWKYPNVGDKIEGTYIDRRVGTNRLKPGEEQIVYTLKTPEGIITDVYGKAGIDAQMKNVKLGQIIGFEFTEEKPPSQPGHSATKIVQVYANEKIVDEDWVKGINTNADASSSATPEPTAQPAPTPAAPAATTAPATPSATADLEETIKEINNLAIAKLGAVTPEEVKTKAMEATGLAFIEGNLPQILDALKALPDVA